MPWKIIWSLFLQINRTSNGRKGYQDTRLGLSSSCNCQKSKGAAISLEFCKRKLDPSPKKVGIYLYPICLLPPSCLSCPKPIVIECPTWYPTVRNFFLLLLFLFKCVSLKTLLEPLDGLFAWLSVPSLNAQTFSEMF